MYLHVPLFLSFTKVIHDYPVKIASNTENTSKIKEGLSCWSSGYDSASSAEGTGSILGLGTNIPHAAWLGQKKKEIKKRTQNPATQGSALLVTLCGPHSIRVFELGCR